jgi:hypothetical protein
MPIWSQILFNLAVIINLIVTVFYPFDTDGPIPDPGTHLLGLDNLYNNLIFIFSTIFFINTQVLSGHLMLLSAAVAITLPKPWRTSELSSWQ